MQGRATQEPLSHSLSLSLSLLRSHPHPQPQKGGEPRTKVAGWLRTTRISLYLMEKSEEIRNLRNVVEIEASLMKVKDSKPQKKQYET